METDKKQEEKSAQLLTSIAQSLTLKGFIIGIITLLLLIPGVMIQNLIREREDRSKETIRKINEKWSLSQTLCGPVLTIPFTTTYAEKGKETTIEQHLLYLTPEDLNIETRLFPEERYYGIYKTILYKSEIHLSGQFAPVNQLNIENSVLHFDKAYISLGISDLRGVTNYLNFNLNGKQYTAEIGSGNVLMDKRLVVYPEGAVTPETTEAFRFECDLNLNGSSSINFIPIGNTTRVKIEGDWKSPGFIGSFTPEYKLDDKSFNASWNVLSFNRSIPESWIDNGIGEVQNASFGVTLVDTVDHYQQNMRSAKYAFMFIALTFVVFFFVEVLTKKRIHPVQYLLVGIALILFYSLLLSISEQLNFAIAYLIAGSATIALITTYAHSVFRNKTQTGILAFILCVLYIFLYVVLQLEDIALLIGSIGLFIILGIIMYVSRKIL
ncbi:cell envelope integrity protein CreD [Bacteroidia bacterium]|nr:cell envelope integrity protein CreD [Bacteroidia bacterium]GHT28944.1 cell envelope integrity protein CreD [Bacteroidia bacterium]GHT85048.1 cell envelope integrity protein CreD [Bacteroidia bacterium]